MGSRFFIEKVKCGVTNGGMACGPVLGNVIVTIQYRKENGASEWISNAECMGIATIYHNEFDPFDTLMSEDVDNPKFGVGMIDSFEGISFYDYEDMFEAFVENKDNAAIPLLRLLIAVTRAASDDVKRLIAMSEGKYVDEIDIPISDIEEEYLEEYEEDA